MPAIVSRGLQKHIRRQKRAIKLLSRDPEEERRLIKELLNKFYGTTSRPVQAPSAAGRDKAKKPGPESK